jgi:outer membrane receptor protein involved in Fe transport
MKKLVYGVISIVLMATSMFAQNSVQVASSNKPAANVKAVAPGMVTGRVIDELSKSPIEYANVMLVTKQNAQMVSGIASDKNGEFSLTGIPNGNYDLSVTFIGFKKKVINDVKIDDGNYIVNLKEITLKPDAVQMKENEVVAEKSAMEFKIDKKVVNVSQTLNATGGTAVDVLQNQPSVQIDANGNLTLRGSGNFTVMVDGRPSVLQGTDALKQIPANIIDNIEIITNPSAKYDAEGTAGIINIVTKKINVTSTSAIVNSGVGTGDKYNGDFNLGYRTQDFNLTIGGDGRRYYSPQDLVVDRTQATNDIHSTARLFNKRDAYTARFSFDRYFSEKTTLGINGTYGYLDVNFNVNTANKVKSLDGSTVNPYSATDDGTKNTVEYFNGSINFSNVFTPKVNDLYFEATITKLRLPNSQTTTENTTLSDGSTQVSLRGRENNTSRIDSRIKLNYKHNLAEKRTFEAGLQANLFYKNIEIVSSNFDNATQVWNIDNNYSNKFDFRNNIYAAFSTYSDQLAGFDYQAGLRLEYTDRLLDQITTKQQYKYKELHLFPTLNISKQISSDQQVQFSFSRRIQRPYDGQLNPYTYFSDTYTATGGNPSLLPSFTNSFELNYQKSFKDVYITVLTYLRRTTDGIEQIQILDNTGRLNLNNENADNTTSTGAEISANITIAPWFKLDPSINLFNFNLEAKPELGIKEQNSFMWNSRINSTFMLSMATRIQFYANYFPKQLTSQGDVQSFAIIGASIRQEFFDRQLIATLSAQNLFGQTKFNVISDGIGFHSNITQTPEWPVFNLSLSYNFNNFKKKNTEQVDANIQGF